MLLRFRKTALLATILAGIVVLGLAPSANAAFRLRIEDGTGQGVVLTDKDGDGVIGFFGTIGKTAVTFTGGIASPPGPGGQEHASLSLGSLTVTTNGPGTIVITLEAEGFTGGPDGPQGMHSAVADVSLPTGSSLHVNTWVNPDNLMPEFGAKDQLTSGSLKALDPIPNGSVAGFGSKGTTITAPGGFSGPTSVGFTKDGPYSLFTQATLTFSGKGIMAFGVQQTVASEPTGLLLAVTSLPMFGVGYLRWRLRKRA